MKYKNILIPLDDTAKTDKIVDFVCSINSIINAKINVVYVIEVPRELPLNTIIPEKDEKAKMALKKAEEIAQKNNADIHTAIIYARTAEDSILSTAEELKCDMIALSHENPKYKFFASSSMNVFQRAKCNIWLFNIKNE